MQASMKAAFQQRDSTQIVINSTESVTLAVPANTNGSTIIRNVTKLLCSTEFFQHYAAMYDQFKIDGVSVSAEIVYNTFGQAAMTFPNVISAWDRNGIDKATVNVTSNGVTQTEAPLVPGPYQVASYSSAVSRAYYPGARWGITRRLVASSLQEKSIYLPTVKTAEVMTESSLYAAWNPDFLMSVLLGAATPTCQSLVFNLSWSWVLTLRGLRKTSLDIISTPLPNTVGYEKHNAGTIASGSDNAMIPVVKAAEVTRDGAKVIETTPYYLPQVQSYSGVHNASSIYVNDVFKYTMNAILSSINGVDMPIFGMKKASFTEIAPNSDDTTIMVSAGNKDRIRARFVMLITEEDTSVKGYHVYPHLIMNACNGKMSNTLETEVLALDEATPAKLAIKNAFKAAGYLSADMHAFKPDYEKVKVTFKKTPARTVIYSEEFDIPPGNTLNSSVAFADAISNQIYYQYTIGNTTVPFPVLNKFVSTNAAVIGADVGHSVVPVLPTLS